MPTKLSQKDNKRACLILKALEAIFYIVSETPMLRNDYFHVFVLKIHSRKRH